jgi:integrase
MGVKVQFYRGAWWIFIHHRGRRRSKKVGDRATAFEVARRVRERLMFGDLSLLGTDSDTFESYAKGWLKDGEAARKASTHRFYKFNVELHLMPTLKSQRIGSITRADCRKVLAECRKKKLNVGSLQGIQRTLSAVLSQAVEDGILPANPAFRMGRHLRKGDEPRREIHPLTREDAQKLLSTIERHQPEYYAFFLCALRTGLRLGELLALQWGDLDFTNRIIEVQRNLVSGKLTTPKNTNRRRVDMSTQLAETLEGRLVAAKAAALKAGKTEPPAWVFTNREGEPLDGDNLRRRVFQPALTKAKLRQVRIHDAPHVCVAVDSARRVTRVCARPARALVDPGHRRRLRTSRAW